MSPWFTSINRKQYAIKLMHLPLYEVDIADKQTYKECTNSVASSEYKLTVKNLY